MDKRFMIDSQWKAHKQICKNLFDIDDYIVTGSSDGLGSYLRFTNHLEYGKTYTITSKKPLQGFKLAKYKSDINVAIVHNNNGWYTGTFTVNEHPDVSTTTTLYVMLRMLETDYWLTDVSQLDGFDIQIEEGTTATEYEPYTDSFEDLNFELCKGGYFSPEDEYGLKVVGKTEQQTLSGKNIFDVENVVYDYLSSDSTYDKTNNISRVYSNSTLTYVATYAHIGKLKDLKGKTITVSFKYKTSSEASSYLRVGYWTIKDDGTRDSYNEVDVTDRQYLNNNPTDFAYVSGSFTIPVDFDESLSFDGDVLLPLYANSSGTLTSSDNNWCEYQDIQIEISKDIFPKWGYSTGTVINGITVTRNDDNSITLNGTATARTLFGLYDKISLKSGVTYTLSYDTDYDAPNNVQVWYNNTYAWIIGTSHNKAITKSTALSNATASCVIIIEAGATLNNQTYKIAFEKVATPTSYEPYCGGVPSPNPDYPQPIQKVAQGTEISVSGENLIPISEFYASKPLSYGHIAPKAFVDVVNSLPKNRPFWFSHKVDSNLPQYTNDNYAILYTNYERPVYNRYNVSGLYSDEVCDAVRFYWNGPNATTTDGKEPYVRYYDICLHLDSRKPYTSYVQGCTITTPCDLYEGDIWYPMSGKVVRKYKEMVCTGQENWWDISGDYSASRFSLPLNLAKQNLGQSDKGAYSNYFKNITFNQLWDYGQGIALHNTISQISIHTTDTLNSIGVFKAWLAEKYASDDPVKIVYLLNEPEVEQYDPQPCFMPCGTVNIWQKEIDLKCTIGATALIRR